MSADLSLSNFNTLGFNYENPKLVEVVSSTEIFIGTSQTNKDEYAAIWQIKKIWQDGLIWKFEYPLGDQSFSYIWANRASYTYA